MYLRPASRLERDDRKVDIPGIPAGTREDVLDLLFRRLAERLTAEERKSLDGVLFSGDAQSRGAAGGHELVLKLVTDHLGVAAKKHRLGARQPRRAARRRARFDSSGTRASLASGATTAASCHGSMASIPGRRPLLSGTDWSLRTEAGRSTRSTPATGRTSHRFCPSLCGAFWDGIPDTLAAGDTAVAAQLRSQLQALARYDMARVSEQQLEALRTIVASTPRPGRGRQLRIAVMHHHLRSPSLREELKPFADMSNLEQVRAWLRGSGVGIVVHGHKHEHAAYFDHIYAGDADDMHRVLVLSGATFEVGRESDAAAIDHARRTPPHA